MPLVIFNYYASQDGNAPLDHYKQTLKIPHHAMNAKWSLVAVNAAYYNDDKEDFKHVDIEFPELMSTQNILFNTSALGDTDTPEPTFRFYVTNNRLSQHHTRLDEYPASQGFWEFPVYNVVNEYPNWSLGDLKLESDEISIIVSARHGNVSSFDYTKLSSFSIILSYE